MRNVFDTSTNSVQTNNTPAPLVSIGFTPAVGNKLRYTAFVQFSVDSPSAALFEIIDSISGVVVGGLHSYPTVVIVNHDTILLEWEAQVLVPGARTVTLQMSVNAGLITSTEAYLSVDEIAI